ncbi:ERCC4-domain-containing protein [Metschnikowia bicuspidata var. bicuspidata NRRL YB-4993]|uniref:Crossover junction endonuclease MUS81 n=1 Tax=Metschnikowia bicuspidata var. bicuspidata NRRL YB-4993 TaxID=869754 RepID=A0A1A0HIU4_9ASCO|nr:ERCC4-domain-containing protein [Metschnikowia bicuspidata var. bicuspidata NRRL YB-4993]OBA23807.1 ERCC4-domain-containing protein [Metschnikowia bicuspidata var. bicuspidata NRRL YB-4993]
MSDLDLNALFVQWLQERHDELTTKGTKTAHAYLRALEKIRVFPDHITTPRQLLGIPFVGAKLGQFLCRRLAQHCADHALAVPAAFFNHTGHAEGGRRAHELDAAPPAKRRKAPPPYVPRRRSGPWAILVALHTRDRARRGLRKEAVIAGAEAHCDQSFTANAAARDFHSAWAGVKTLVRRGLVHEHGRPKTYVLTAEGAALAAVLLRQEGVHSLPARGADMSFDNGVRVTPSSSVPHDAAHKTYAGISYDVWAPADFDVVLLLDNREIRSKSERDFFHNKLSARGVACDVRGLAVGDVLWVARHKHTRAEAVLNYVCERKRIDDLASSIRDGRFAEQKARLKRSGIKNIYYLVEEAGLMDALRVVDMKASLDTAIAMVITVSRFYMQRFRKVDDTVEWLAAMSKVLLLRYLATRLLVLKPRNVHTHDAYLRMLQDFRPKFETRSTPYECVHLLANYQDSLLKSSMTTVKEIFVKMLMLVRGVSFEKALLIQRHFHTPRALIEFYLENDALTEDEKGALIWDRFKDEVGPRKFSKPALVAMYEAWGKATC